MKVTSTKKVILIQDREGVVEEFIQIAINVERKDDVAKIYHVKTADFMLLNKGTENEAIQVLINRHGNAQEKSYEYPYAVYDGQKTALSQMFPTDLTGSELDDYLLLMALKVNLTTEPVYGLTGEDWE